MIRLADGSDVFNRVISELCRAVAEFVSGTPGLNAKWTQERNRLF